VSQLGNNGDGGDDDDFLRGARAIGEYLKIPERAVFHLIHTGRFPYFRMGTARIWARKSDLRTFIDLQVKKNLENGGPRPPKPTKPSDKH
jgi:hypothetical protein